MGRWHREGKGGNAHHAKNNFRHEGKDQRILQNSKNKWSMNIVIVHPEPKKY